MTPKSLSFTVSCTNACEFYHDLTEKVIKKGVVSEKVSVEQKKTYSM